MTLISMSNLIDIIILALLAGTVFYAMRLSEQLNILKDSKSELEQLVSNLSINIRRAHEAIQEMQEVATNSGDELQDLIEKGQSLSSELQIMNESSNNLANRLESGIDRIPTKAESYTDSYSDTPYNDNNFDEFDEDIEDTAFERQEQRQRQRPKPKSRQARSVENFFIRDRDFEANFEEELDDYEDYEDEFRNLSSRAEKQLASAIRRNRKFDA